AIGFLDDAAGHRTGSLANRAGKRPKAAIRIDHRDGFRGLFARPGHHLGPHMDRIIAESAKRMTRRWLADLWHPRVQRGDVLEDRTVRVAGEKTRDAGPGSRWIRAGLE